MRKVGKHIGNAVYAHRTYEHVIVPASELKKAKEAAGTSICGYECIRYNRRSRSVAFQFCDDFDVADEPTVGDTILVNPDGNITVTPRGSDPMVWHHKWMWVSDAYAGFDVEASKKRSEKWKSYITKYDLSRIGRKSYWDKIRKQWE